MTYKSLVLCIAISLFSCNLNSQKTDNQPVVDCPNQNDIVFPSWVDIILKEKKIIVATKSINLKYLILDINGDNITECAIANSNNILFVFKDGSIHKIERLEDHDKFGYDDVQLENLHMYWYVDDNKNINQYLLEEKVKKTAKGQVIEAVQEGAGSIIIYYNGEEFKCYFTD